MLSLSLLCALWLLPISATRKLLQVILSCFRDFYQVNLLFVANKSCIERVCKRVGNPGFETIFNSYIAIIMAFQGWNTLCGELMRFGNVSLFQHIVFNMQIHKNTHTQAHTVKNCGFPQAESCPGPIYGTGTLPGIISKSNPDQTQVPRK